MRTTWEYMTMVYDHRREIVNEQWTWPSTYYILRADSDSADERPGETNLLVLLNELGAEGWELVGNVILRSTIVKSATGWSEESLPVRQRWLFKRQAEPTQAGK